MQIKTTMRYHIPIRMTNIKILTIPRADKDSEQLEFSCTIGRTRNKNSTATLKNGLEFFL